MTMENHHFQVGDTRPRRWKLPSRFHGQQSWKQPRPGLPEPQYDHPHCVPDVEPVPTPTIPCMMMPVPVAPLAPELAPQEVGLFLQFRGMRPETAHAEELQAFLGRTLELLILPPESTEQMRAQLRCWQRRLRWSTAGCRLTWAEAFALYGLQGDVG